jgi:hypothetical protein
VTDGRSLYAVFQGAYEGTEDNPEIWQFGIRLALVFGTIDPDGTLPTWDVVPRTDASTTTNWSSTTTFNITDPGGTAIFDSLDYMETVLQPAFEAYMASVAFSEHTKATGLKLYPINATGHVVEARSVSSVATADLPGGASGNMTPPQVSLAVSTQTDVIGRRGRGRFYLPGSSVTHLDAMGRLATGAIPNQVNAAQAFVEALTVSPTLPFDPHVHAAVIGSPWTNYGKISNIRIGDVLDTQRRRRRQLVEAYTGATIAP